MDVLALMFLKNIFEDTIIGDGHITIIRYKADVIALD